MQRIHLLPIRYRQGIRLMRELGFYTLLIAAAVLFFIYASYLQYLNSSFAPFFSLILVATCFVIQAGRPDTGFIYKNIPGPFLEMYLEYSILIFPFTVTALFTSNWYCFFLSYAVLLLIPLYRSGKDSRTHLKNISVLISFRDFEIISGIRKNYLFLIPLYLLALCLCWVKILPLILLWIITGILISFYEENEDLSILKAPHQRPEALLRGKLLHHGRYMLLLYLPVLILHALFQDTTWVWIGLIFLFSQLTLLGFGIYFKYSLYEPHTRMKANSMVSGILLLVSLIPFFLPVPLLMAMIYYYKAKNNLTTYLYD